MPQGTTISPLLSKLYMWRFILGRKLRGYPRHWSAHIVKCADDLVICCKGQADKAMEAMRDMMRSLKLAVNDDKTRLCRIPQERFDFLGYTLGRCYNRETGPAYIGTRPRFPRYPCRPPIGVFTVEEEAESASCERVRQRNAALTDGGCAGEGGITLPTCS